MLVEYKESEVYAWRDVAAEVLSVGCDEVVGDGCACIDHKDGTVLTYTVDTFVVGTNGCCKAVWPEGLWCFVTVVDGDRCRGVKANDVWDAEMFDLSQHLGCHIDGR